MSATIIDGKKLAGARAHTLKLEIEELIKKIGRKPKLLAVELANDEGSKLYLKLKKSLAERVGIDFEVSEIENLKLKIENLENSDGVFLQHPPHFDKQKWQELVDQISPEKDVDCLTSTNLNLIKKGNPRFLPATVKAIGYCLFSAFGITISQRTDLAKQGRFLSRFLFGKRVVILGRSPIVGLPLSWWLKSLGGIVTLLGSDTKNISEHTKKADILISTVGKPNLVTGDMVKTGAIVIDSGSPLGDVAFSDVAKKASAITPVPGGVGPLTVISLMENVVQSVNQTSREGSLNLLLG